MLTYVITGANRGLGFGMARQLANEGNKVIGTARDLSAATDLAALPGVSVVQLDTTDPVSCKKAALEVSDLTGGTIDVLIANAGYNGTAAFFDLEEFPADDMLVSELELTYRTNVMGSILSINAFLPLLKKGQKKTVVAISSGMGDLKFQQDLEYSANAVYGASKAALSFVMGKYAIKHEHDGMIFFSLCPGWVDVTPDGKPSPYTEEALGPFVKMLQKVEPSCGGPKNLNDGAAACLTVIKGLTKEHSGQFLSYHGDKNWI